MKPNPFETIECSVSQFKEINTYLHTVGGATGQQLFTNGRALITAQVSEDTKLYLLLKYPSIKIRPFKK